jgi:tRNA threonylcarbamoyladenosine biosynthesis protein TsaE
MKEDFVSDSPEVTLRIAREIGESLLGGEIILLKGQLGAGKTHFTKGLMAGLGFDQNEVNSPSFALVNNYRGKFDVYHIDLWRMQNGVDIAFAVGLDEMLEIPLSIIIIEWADKLVGFDFGRPVVDVEITGNGDQQRSIKVEEFSGMENPAG